MEWYLWLAIFGGGLGIALLFEESRDYIVEGFQYIINLDWWSDFTDFLGSAFENLSEFSVYGLTFGVLTTVFLFFISKWTLAPFLVYYDTTGKIIWTIVTYVGTFVAGYLMGKAFENSG